MKKSKKRFYLLVVLSISLSAVLIIIFRYPSGKEFIPVKVNYPFRMDGHLYFISPGHTDTLAGIQIEIVKTEDEIMRGLMNRDSMRRDRGMLFVFEQEQDRNFWMKNTRIPLDIIFIDRDKRIRYIAEHTTPYSTNPIPSFYPARYVLEVNAGFCKDHRIRAGVLIDYQ